MNILSSAFGAATGQPFGGDVKEEAPKSASSPSPPRPDGVRDDGADPNRCDGGAKHEQRDEKDDGGAEVDDAPEGGEKKMGDGNNDDNNSNNGDENNDGNSMEFDFFDAFSHPCIHPGGPSVDIDEGEGDDDRGAGDYGGGAADEDENDRDEEEGDGDGGGDEDNSSPQDAVAVSAAVVGEYDRDEEEGDGDKDNSSLQDAVAVSAALVGESVIDSPGSMGTGGGDGRGSGGKKIWGGDGSPLREEGGGRNGLHSEASSSAAPNVPQLPSASGDHRALVPAARGDSSNKNGGDGPPEDEEGMLAGFLAQGLAWVEAQRDRRRRQYLQSQAEQQLEKIRQAKMVEKLDEDQQPRGLLHNSTFQNLAFSALDRRSFFFLGSSSVKADSSSKDKEHQKNSDNSNRGFTWGIVGVGGVRCGKRNTDEEDKSSEEKNEKAAIVSQSGDGYTVHFHDMEDDDEEKEDLDASFIPTVRVEPENELSLNPFLLTADQMQQVALHVLPRGIAYARWTRLYSLARDGDDFDVCLARVSSNRMTLLVVRTSRDAVMGGFADAPWDTHDNLHHHHHSATSSSTTSSFNGPQYYGGPNACLFAVDNGTGKIRQYKWSGANRYIQLCDPAPNRKMLAFGGGGVTGAFGLSVERDFQAGSTGRCDTFENEPLCEQENFSIVDMEIYGFLIGQF